MGERLNLDGGTLNLDGGRSISMGDAHTRLGARPPRPPNNLSTACSYFVEKASGKIHVLMTVLEAENLNYTNLPFRNIIVVLLLILQ